MRRPALALVIGFVLAGCGQGGQEASYGGGEPQEEGDQGSDGASGDSPGSPDGAAACAVDSDCVAAASTCCECPTFAVPGGGDHNAGCDEVECEAAPAECPALEPACDDGVCTLRCAPVPTDKSCEGGFARDEAGCLIDECAPPSSSQPTCLEDDDCVQVAADCCGCARGGADTAVPAERVDAHMESLGCSGEDACPEVDVCEPDAMPMCVRGQCTLATAPAGSGSGGELCGTPELPPCPEGLICLLNAIDSPEAAELGVGACRQP